MEPSGGDRPRYDALRHSVTVRRVEIHEESKCGSCRAPVVWALTEKGKPMPVNAERVPEGNIVLQYRAVGMPPTVKLLGRVELDELRQQHEYNLSRGIDDGNDRLYVSHFANCPQANLWRKRKKGR